MYISETPDVDQIWIDLRLDKVVKRVINTDFDECWLWTGALSEEGYARIYFEGKGYNLHRIFYKHYKDLFNNELLIDHKCYIRNCLNFNHLRQTTSQQNLLNKMPVELKEYLKMNNHPNWTKKQRDRQLAIEEEAARRRAVMKAIEPRACEECLVVYTPKKKWQRFCSQSCRMSHWLANNEK